MSYHLLENSLFTELPHHIPKGLHIALIVDESLWTLYEKKLRDSLSPLNTHFFFLPPGEEHKTRKTKEELEDQLLEKGLGKDTCLIAFGGGVATDLVGYLASTYCRGIPLILCPTSLLAMVDASIGGKNGVNTPYGKNLIGSFYEPHKILIDLNLLKTLPHEELINGAAEVIKHALIADPSFFAYLEDHAQGFLQKKPEVLAKALKKSYEIKKNIVNQDQKEQGLRRLLNYGHTVAHALEKIFSYHLPHGKAVAIGLLLESHLAMQLNLLSKEAFQRIENILQSYQLPVKIPSPISLEVLYDCMVLDKKSLQKTPRFVLLKEIGLPIPYEGSYCTPVDKKALGRALEYACRTH